MSELCIPCGCKGEGMKFAHRACIQTWISTKESANLRSDKCEVCGCPWRAGLFAVAPQLTPAQRTLVRIEESQRQRQRVSNLLTAAYLRTTLKMPRTNDVHILMSLGPHVPGEWSPWIARELRRQQRTQYWSRWRCFSCFRSSNTDEQQRLRDSQPSRTLLHTPGEASARGDGGEAQ